MDFGRKSFPLNFNPMRQKERFMLQQQTHGPNIIRPNCTVSATFHSQISNLKQCISAYLDSIQMVSRAGSWLAQTFSCLFDESQCSSGAVEMKMQFSKMLELSISATTQAKSDLALLLEGLTMPNINHKNQLQAVKECKLENAKVLEKCIKCLSEVHSTFFKDNFDSKSSQAKTNDQRIPETSEENSDVNTATRKVNCTSEWDKLVDTDLNVKSWGVLKQKSNVLRKYHGLSDMEVQNLLKDETVSKLYLEKLNQRIDMALRNYEIGLRGLQSESVIVFGTFSSSPRTAELVLEGCCSKMEMEQVTQRLQVSQFLHCELPLMPIVINNRDFPSDSRNSMENINQKKNAVRQLLQFTNPKLSISETDSLSYEILGDVCPARWRTHVKASLQLFYGNTGLVIMDTVDGESNAKRAMISQKDHFIVVSVTSTWCVKEDPGTMSLLQRHLDPEKFLAIIHVRYVSIFQSKPYKDKRFEPGIFVESFVETGSLNRRRASQTLRKTQTLFGVPLSSMSICWLTNRLPEDESPVSANRNTDSSHFAHKQSSTTPNSNTVIDSENGTKHDRKRTKKLVVEIKEHDSTSEEEKSSDDDDSVKDVINMLSGGNRPSFRRRNPQISDKSTDTDIMSKASEDILDSQLSSSPEKSAEVLETDNEKVIFPGDSTPTRKSSQPEESKSSIVSTGSYMLPENPVQYIAFHQKSKSQTLPDTFRESAPVFHPQLRSMSNTLPVYGRNPYWSTNMSAAHSPNRNGNYIPPQNIGSSIPEALPPQLYSPVQSLNMPYSNHVSDASLRNSVTVPERVPTETHGPYDLWTRDAQTQAPACPNNYNLVEDMLNNVKNVSVSYDALSLQQNNLKETFAIHQIQGLNRMAAENLIPVHQNSNNNNRSRNLVGNKIESASMNLNQHQSNPYGPDVVRAQFNNRLPTREEDFDRVGFTRSKESLGPIGSPVVGRHANQQKSSNTWPNRSDFPSQPTTFITGDSEYEQYVVEVARNAINRKHLIQTNSTSTDNHRGQIEWKEENSWHPMASSKLGQRSLEGSQSKPEAQAGLISASVGMDDNLPGLPNDGTDSTRTGTWPPWHPWLSSGSGLWNWETDSYNGIRRDENN